ncbi:MULTISPECIES: peptidylprolyl isomerase [unclassified Coleofasciculus]|uniref:peptidylprolyl isomerase n=1 Tax=unclassified Coleofasciculus TaxID=2692782 RepID=UPI00188275AB|nr:MULTISPECIES: peptidylprolyl isomerase [unclassified Coleofasciculus]MBE9129487.1 peptidylprolyl isomerase [Coleofasciculus sp. LEGE 07081]MBE9148273.1 peptidylprolyl isomerase [Coleofasciculus sp. LEGE 07092]
MTAVLQVGDQTIRSEELIPLLAKYQLLPQLVRELVIEQAIALIDYTPEEKTTVCQIFYEKNQVTSESERQAWLERQGITPEQAEDLAIRGLKLEKFKQATWGNKLESYFLKRKGQLDRVVYSLIRTKDAPIAQELYFRIKEGEQPFAELARDYSQGPEAQTGGLVGPVELSVPHPVLAQMLTVSQPGQLWHPTRLGEWFIIVRLEKFFPVQLDESMRQRLLNELFNTWLQEQLQQQVSINSLNAATS